MLQILYTLGKTLYDEERGVEYPPLKCMNNDVYADAIKNKSAKECIFAINATAQLNSDIAYSFRRSLVERRFDLLINYTEAKNGLLLDNNDYSDALKNDEHNKVYFYESPFVETQLLISETADLVYEKSSQTGTIKISEQGSNRKDRYTSASYGNFFLDKLEIDLIGKSKHVEFDPSKFIMSTQPTIRRR